jgi:putative DNA primase/helicase
MKENFFEFKPTHTLSLIGNHRPKVKGRDNGIWRRLRLIGFDAEIPDERQDLKLPNKLQKEYPAILQWAVRGCLDWQRRGGLDEPRAVRVATDNYKAEQDVVGSFIDERCMLDKTYKVKSGQLYSAYHDWCEQAGETPQNSREFRREMETSRGFNYVKNNCVWVHGITTLNN